MYQIVYLHIENVYATINRALITNKLVKKKKTQKLDTT